MKGEMEGEREGVRVGGGKNRGRMIRKEREKRCTHSSVLKH